MPLTDEQRDALDEVFFGAFSGAIRPRVRQLTEDVVRKDVVCDNPYHDTPVGYFQKPLRSKPVDGPLFYTSDMVGESEEVYVLEEKPTDDNGL